MNPAQPSSILLIYELMSVCEGEEGQIFVDCSDKKNEKRMILLLDCSTAELSTIRYTPAEKLGGLVCYIPRHRFLVLLMTRGWQLSAVRMGRCNWSKILTMI